MAPSQPRSVIGGRGRYAASLCLVAATSSACGLTIWQCLHPKNGQPLLLSWAGIAAAASLTAVATIEWRRLRRAQPKESAATVTPEAPGRPPVLLTRTHRLALPPPSWLRLKSTEYIEQEMKKMERPRVTTTPHGSPENVALERERLRKAGLTETQIQMLLAGDVGGGTRNAPLGTGVATGVINNLDVVMTHLRGLVPSVKFDLTRMLDPLADSATRISGAVSLGVKMIAAVVIGYFVYLEALQFRSAAYKSWAEACIERQKNAINFSTVGDLYSGKGLGRDLEKECAQ